MKVYDLQGKEKGSVDLPEQFKEEVRADLIAKAIEVIEGNARQPYGAAPEAGKRSSSYVSKRRKVYKSTYGIGQSRTPRKVMSSSGMRFNFVGAFAPQTVGGRRAHPPKAEKIWEKKMNKKERRKAIRSAMAATLLREVVVQRGHKVPKAYPFIVEAAIESLKQVKAVKQGLLALGLQDELKRASVKKVRAGKGKMRGRRYVKKVGPLIVVAGECDLLKGGKNLAGVDIVSVKQLNAQLLAPGKVPGRLTLWSEKAIATVAQKRLFTNHPVKDEKTP